MTEIIVVTGLPRSGTSLMMQLLDAADIPVYADDIRGSDDNNPKGYYESQIVKDIAVDSSFLQEAQGMAIKIVSPLMAFADPKLSYRVIVMRREMDEILMSQEKMLQKDQTSEREKYRTIYEFHLKKTYGFLENNEIPFLDVNYSALINNTKEEVGRVGAFLGVNWSKRQTDQIIQTDLYRNRRDGA